MNPAMSNSVITSAREKAGNLWLEFLSRRRKRRISRLTDPASFIHLQSAVQINCKWYGTSYGGFYIMPSLLDRSSVIYSFGTGRDISFDRVCIRKHGASVFAFDPTPKSIEWTGNQKLPDRFHFHPFGISASITGQADFFLPANPRAVSGSLVKHMEVDAAQSVKVMMKTFEDIIRELKHTHIDVLKMDIEGSEYDHVIFRAFNIHFKYINMSVFKLPDNVLKCLHHYLNGLCGINLHMLYQASGNGPWIGWKEEISLAGYGSTYACLLYTSPSPRDGLLSR